MTGKAEIIRAVLLTVGVIGLLWFLLPSFFVSLNIGNLTGIAVLLLLTLYACLMPTVNSLLVRVWSSAVGKAVLLSASAAVTVIAVLAVTVCACMASAVSVSGSEGATAVVLGCRVYGERASLMLNERLEAAKKYLEENPTADCVLSGGMGEGETITEAECMYRWLVANGISPDRLFKEESSTSTRENLFFSRQTVADNRLNESIVIITNEFHQYRASRAAESAGITEVGSVSGKTAWWLFPTYCVREMYGILYEWWL